MAVNPIGAGWPCPVTLERVALASAGCGHFPMHLLPVHWARTPSYIITKSMRGMSSPTATLLPATCSLCWVVGGQRRHHVMLSPRLRIKACYRHRRAECAHGQVASTNFIRPWYVHASIQTDARTLLCSHALLPAALTLPFYMLESDRVPRACVARIGSVWHDFHIRRHALLGLAVVPRS